MQTHTKINSDVVCTLEEKITKKGENTSGNLFEEGRIDQTEENTSRHLFE
jgi:hypothetical protein